MSQTPDPTENYLSKYLVDFNQRELNKFLRPDKFPKAAATFTALAVIVFIFIASTTPIKDRLFNSLYPKPASQASELSFNLEVPDRAFVGREFMVTVTASSESVKNFYKQIDFDNQKLEVESIDSSSSQVTYFDQKSYDNKTGAISLSGTLNSTPEQSYQIVKLILKSQKAGAAKFGDKEINILPR